jgi:methyltransferase (TIGR00027 family)
VSLGQLKVMGAIERCRTAALGGHVARCENTAFRAQESAMPEHKRLFYDPFAVSFLGPRLRTVSPLFHIPFVRLLLAHLMDACWPGARTSAIARTCLIDEWASSAAAAGMQQVLILGAGFDCRAWRLPALRDLPVFEIDHPATSAEKRRLIGELGAPTGRVSFAPIDFERESLPEALAKVGFRADKLTLVLWEGVTNYLTAEAVDTTLRWIATLAESSQLIFTYVDADLVNGSGRFKDAARARRAVTNVGEPWTFGFRPEELPAYLNERGLKLTMDMSANEYRALAMGARGARAKGYEFYHVALVQVGV